METGKGTSVYTVSNHAKERYAERCKDRDSRLEITTYVAEHSQRIEEEINQMLRYGKRVYTGRTEGKGPGAQGSVCERPVDTAG